MSSSDEDVVSVDGEVGVGSWCLLGGALSNMYRTLAGDAQSEEDDDVAAGLNHSGGVCFGAYVTGVLVPSS